MFERGLASIAGALRVIGALLLFALGRRAIGDKGDDPFGLGTSIPR